MLMLTQPVEPLAFVRLEARFHLKVVAGHMTKTAGRRSMTRGVFGQVFNASDGIEISDRVLVEPYLRGHSAVADCRALLVNFEMDGCGVGGEQGLRQIVTDFRILRGTQTQTVRSPRFDPHPLMSQVPDKRLVLLLKARQNFTP